MNERITKRDTEWDIAAGFVDKSIFGVPVDEIGKTVFLTREEADHELKRVKGW